MIYLAYTPNCNLYIDNAQSTKFVEWIDKLAGPNNSNMVKIDNALKDALSKANSAYDLALNNKFNEHKHNASDITGGTFSTNVLPVVPIFKGGTGAVTAPAALENLGAFPSIGGTINGDVNIVGALDVKNNTMHLGSGTSGAKLNFGDGDYVHLYENPDDTLEIKASNINFVVSGKITQNGNDFGGGGGSSYDWNLKADKANPVFTGSISLGRESNTTVGSNSVAMGYYLTASGDNSFAQGYNCVASGSGSHAEGNNNTASGINSHAEGSGTTASGINSHAEGSGTTASGIHSHAEGFRTTASDYAHASGKYSKAMTTSQGTATATGDAFVIGNGTNSSTRSNALRVTFAGETYGLSAFNSYGADYAEYFEWDDSNPNNEDRVGYFVTVVGKKIKIAQPGDYILGIVSGQPCIIGNADEDWLGKWEHDEFDRFILEYLEETDETDEDGNTIFKIADRETSNWRYKVNPEYDTAQQYIERKNRPEWSAVGMVGVLSVRDDGTCQVNSFCKVADGGIGTYTDDEFTIQDGKIVKSYRVIERVNDNVIKVILK